MNFFKNRKIAAAITALIIPLSLIFGINRSLRRVAGGIDAMFYDGIYVAADNYTAPSIDALLDNQIDAAMGLITVAAGQDAFSQETEMFRQARQALLRAQTIPQKYLANQSLISALNALYPALLDAEGLTEEQAADADYYASAITNAQNVINANLYNEKVAEYYDRTLTTFPVGILRFLIFVDGPVAFGPEP